MVTKLILDVDTGTDDAVALMLAALHPKLEMVAATTVNGNVPVEYCTENTLRVFDHIGVDVPVSEGASHPIVRPDFPVPRGNRAGDDIVLVPTGPLTNIAAAMTLEPRIVARIPRIIIMGGGHEIGNCTPSAEFNIWADPEAARVVLTSGARNMTLVPLDATHKALVSPDDCRRFRELGTPAAEAPAIVTERRIEGYDATEPMARRQTAPVHDALCVAAIVEPSVITTHPYYVDVETHGELTVGRTVIDTHSRSGKEPTMEVALDADERKFVELWFKTFAPR